MRASKKMGNPIIDSFIGIESGEDLDKCRCRHVRRQHEITENVNYSDGPCTKCECIGFVIKKEE